MGLGRTWRGGNPTSEISQYNFAPRDAAHPCTFEMAPIASKRLRENKLELPKKRQRVEAVPNTNSKPTSNALDSLRWKQVTLPDRLEDAEGFFGLEEIEDVDVVRDTQSGKIGFRVGEAHCIPPLVMIC